MVSRLRRSTFLRRAVCSWRALAHGRGATIRLLAQACLCKTHFAIQLHFSEWKMVWASAQHTTTVDQRTIDALWREKRDQQRRCLELERACEVHRRAELAVRQAALTGMRCRRRASEAKRAFGAFRSVWACVHASAAYFSVLRLRSFLQRCLRGWNAWCKTVGAAFAHRTRMRVTAAEVGTCSQASSPPNELSLFVSPAELMWSPQSSLSFQPTFMTAVRQAHIRLAEAKNKALHSHPLTQPKTGFDTGIEESPRYQQFRAALSCIDLRQGNVASQTDDGNVEHPEASPNSGTSDDIHSRHCIVSNQDGVDQPCSDPSSALSSIRMIATPRTKLPPGKSGSKRALRRPLGEFREDVSATTSDCFADRKSWMPRRCPDTESIVVEELRGANVKDYEGRVEHLHSFQKRNVLGGR